MHGDEKISFHLMNYITENGQTYFKYYFKANISFNLCIWSSPGSGNQLPSGPGGDRQVVKQVKCVMIIMLFTEEHTPLVAHAFVVWRIYTICSFNNSRIGC